MTTPSENQLFDSCRAIARDLDSGAVHSTVRHFQSTDQEITVQAIAAHAKIEAHRIVPHLKEIAGRWIEDLVESLCDGSWKHTRLLREVARFNADETLREVMRAFAEQDWSGTHGSSGNSARDAILAVYRLVTQVDLLLDGEDRALSLQEEIDGADTLDYAMGVGPGWENVEEGEV